MPPATMLPLRQSLLKHLTIKHNNLTNNTQGTDTHHTNSIVPAPPTPQEMVVANEASNNQQLLKDLQQSFKNFDILFKEHKKLQAQYQRSRGVPNTSAEDWIGVLDSSNTA